MHVNISDMEHIKQIFQELLWLRNSLLAFTHLFLFMDISAWQLSFLKMTEGICLIYLQFSLWEKNGNLQTFLLCTLKIPKPFFRSIPCSSLILCCLFPHPSRHIKAFRRLSAILKLKPHSQSILQTSSKLLDLPDHSKQRLLKELKQGGYVRIKLAC